MLVKAMAVVLLASLLHSFATGAAPEEEICYANSFTRLYGPATVGNEQLGWSVNSTPAQPCSDQCFQDGSCYVLDLTTGGWLDYDSYYGPLACGSDETLEVWGAGGSPWLRILLTCSLCEVIPDPF